MARRPVTHPIPAWTLVLASLLPCPAGPAVSAAAAQEAPKALEAREAEAPLPPAGPAAGIGTAAPFARRAPRDPALPGAGAPPLVASRSGLYLPRLPLPERLGGGRGVRVGGFAVQPGLATSLAYDDNIDADEDDREDDLIWSTGASVRAQSLLRRHSLGLEASAGTTQFLENREEGGANWLLAADGRLDLDRRSALSGAVSYTRDKEDPASVDGTDDEEEGGGGTFRLIDTGLSYRRQADRLSWTLAGTAGRTEFEDGEDSEDDRWSLGASTSLGYRTGRRLTLFLGPSYTRTLYDGPPDDEREGDQEQEGDGEDRDSEGVAFNLGAIYTIGPLLSAIGSVGYAWRFYDDDDRESTHGVAFTAGLAGGYPIDARTQVTLAADRSIGETRDEDASAVVSTSLRLGLTRLLRRDMALAASVGLARGEYEDDDRLDHTLSTGLTYGWALTGTLSFNAGYSYSQRFSEDGGEDYYRNVFLVGLSARL